MHTDMIDEFAFARPYQAPGETVLWRGSPQPGHHFERSDVAFIPFSIFWCGFAFFWEFKVITSGAPPFFALFGIPFIAVGLYITVGRFFHRAYLNKHTAYVITNQKIIRKIGKKIDMLDAKTMPTVHVTAHADGTGTIRFGQPVYYQRRGGYGYNSWSPSDGIFTLDNIPEVARVQQIIHSIAREY